jgi:hypothetical protein
VFGIAAEWGRFMDPHGLAAIPLFSTKLIGTRSMPAAR